MAHAPQPSGTLKPRQMRQLISTAFIILIMSACCSSKLISKHELVRKNYQEVVGISVIDENKPKPDKYAMYANGLKGIHEHVAKTTRYPNRAVENNIQGKVMVEFIVEKNGQVKEAKIIESVSSELDKEALRVILALKRFYPGIKDSKPVRVLYRFPINFKLK
jgi:TonB family protein